MDRKIIIFFLFVISSAVVFVSQQEALTNKYFFNDDCNQYTFAYYKLNDPQLFQDDIFTTYSLRYNTKVVIFIYALFGKIIDPLLLSKILPFILCFLATFYAFLIGEESDSVEVGFLAAVLFIVNSWTFACFSGGHAKAFVFPLLLSFIFCLMKKKYLALSIILFLQIFTYPPIAVVSMLTLFLLFFVPLEQTKGQPRNIKEIKFFSILLFLASLLLCGLYWIPDDFMGPLFSFEEIINMPEFYSGGRDPHFIDSLITLHKDSVSENIIGIRPYAPPTWILFFLSFIGFILVLIKKIKVHRVLSAVCLSGTMLFLMAWLAFFHLFSPGRYLKFAPFIYLIFLSALTLNYIFKKILPERIKILVLIIAIILTYKPFLNGNIEYYGEKDLYDFLSTLPENSLIAGHPKEMDAIPLLCKRKVFVQRESSLPYYKKYYGEITRRINDFFKLYYSSDTNEAKKINRLHGINYIVIKKEHFSKRYLDQGFFYYDPFNVFAKKVVFENIKKGFLFQSIPEEKRLYEDERFIVIEAEKRDSFL